MFDITVQVVFDKYFKEEKYYNFGKKVDSTKAMPNNLFRNKSLFEYLVKNSYLTENTIMFINKKHLFIRERNHHKLIKDIMNNKYVMLNRLSKDKSIVSDFEYKDLTVKYLINAQVDPSRYINVELLDKFFDIEYPNGYSYINKMYEYIHKSKDYSFVEFYLVEGQNKSKFI